MRKLIELTQENLIVCDNKNCDYKIPNGSKDPNVDIKQYLNVPCPKCGRNLLTEKDYRDSLKFMRIVNWMNKWLSWVTIFSPRKNSKVATIQIHDGFKIKN